MLVRMLDFAEFATAGPLSKAQPVMRVKSQSAYDPKTDWWKQLREFIPRNHKRNGSPDDLEAFLGGVTAERKLASYGNAISHYREWWGTHTINEVSGSAHEVSLGSLQVRVNPELYVSVDGSSHVIKLYFKKSKPLTPDAIATALRLMELAYREGASPVGSPVVALFEISSGRFHVPISSLAGLDAVLLGEAQAFSTIYDSM